jgi:hypothetical protein
MEISSRAEFSSLMKTFDLPMRAVEIGVAEGRFSLEMCQWGMEKLYLVDLWQHVDGMTAELGNPTWDHDAVFQSCMSTLVAYTDRIEVLRGWAHEMAAKIPDGSLGFAYEDATHKEEWVTKSLEAYYPKLVPGGIFAGHDFLNPSFTVKPAVEKFAARHGLTVHVVPENHINDASFWFQKPFP